MYKINRSEADMLRKRGLFRYVYVTSRTHKKQYYVVERTKASELVEKYREECTVHEIS